MRKQNNRLDNRRRRTSAETGWQGRAFRNRRAISLEQTLQQAASSERPPAEELIQAILKEGRVDLPRSCCRSTPAASPHALLKFFGMALSIRRSSAKHALLPSLIVLLLYVSPHRLDSQTTRPPTKPKLVVPAWAQPGSPTHEQVPPPADFHRSSKTFYIPIGVFDGQSDIGAALVPGSGMYDPATKRYTIHSAGYNIWYTRDEFRYVWKKYTGDASLAADATFPDLKGYDDRKVVLMIRQNLDDDSQEAMIGEHGSGMIHLAQRPKRGAMMTDMQYRFGGTLEGVLAKRIGIEKQGDSIAIFVSLKGEPMSQLGPPIHMHFDGPFYVGLGFCSHLPIKPDTAVFSNVVIENSAGKVQ